MNYLAAIVPLDPRVAARVARRRERNQAAAFFANKAEWEQLQATRDWEEKQRWETERFEAEQRRQSEERRRGSEAEEKRKRQREREHDRNNRARIALAKAQDRQTGAIAAGVTLLAAVAWGGREHIGALLKRLGVDMGGGATPETIGALSEVVTHIVVGDDDLALDQAWAAELADYRDAHGEAVQKMTEMAAAAKASVP